MSAQQSTPTPTPIGLRTQQLSAAHGPCTVLQGIDLHVPAGRWTCIVGPNGAGKSTLLQCLAHSHPYQGQVLLGEQDTAHMPARQRACRMAWLGQGQTSANSPSPDLRVWDAVMLGRWPHQGWLSAPTQADEAAVAQALAQTGCTGWDNRVLGALSGGERQRVLLARALAVQAPVLLLDEPLSHLDAPHQADWLQLVRHLNHQGVTVVSVLHELHLALQADHVAILRAGRLQHQGRADDAATHSALREAFAQRITIHRVDGHWVALPTMPEPRLSAFSGESHEH
ncbi:ABC transporter ATP-binding protein [Curvibacter sp. CHRR-16]|uniref:ABC transporter ATP-binding protein n=1 Tax=Curvibacter sp. CHRR-16 TaxID=2835872 RepID=UPI001BDB4EBE|nr:ABC transporter ATP-binding protein [Curvibacter sp. CHRR-16]MBT0569218.1 ABC transporter ATP-binding protein [Curvibacter sp. CHRR-16]